MGDPTTGLRARIRGTLYAAVTDLSNGDGVYGGVCLGDTDQHIFQLVPTVGHVRAPEWGGRRVETVVAAEEPQLIASFRTWDNDAIATIWPRVETDNEGEATERHGLLGKVNDDSSLRGGYKLSQQETVLLFVPDKPTIHRAIILYAAIPDWDQIVEMNNSPAAEWAFLMAFYGAPDANGIDYRYRLLADIPSL